MLRAQFDHQEVRFPTNWNEVTFGQFITLASGRSLMLSLCSDPDLLLQLPDAAAEDAVLPYLAFVADVPDFAQLPLPDSFAVVLSTDGQLSNRTINRPTDLGLATYGQKITIDEELRRLHEADTDNYIDAALPLLSVYLYPQLCGKPFVDILDTKPYESALLALPCTTALPLAAFFLRKSVAFTSSGRVTYRLMPTVAERLPWRKRLAQWFRSLPCTRPTSRGISSPGIEI